MTPPDDDTEVLLSSEEERCLFWGPWTTLAISVGAFLLCELPVPLIVTGLLLSLPNFFPALVNRPSPLEPWLDEAGLISLVAPVKVLLGLVLFVSVARLRKVSFRRYFAVRLPSARTCGAWFLATLCLIVLLDLLRVFSGRPVVVEWVSMLYSDAPSPVLLFVAVVVAAPLYEELLFRGLLLPGLACSRLRPRGAVLVTAAVFALIHFQYDAYDMLTVCALGVFLGVARLASDSTGLTILLHITVNFAALAEAAVKLHFFGE
jgi:membrane protease YdiL (CAAX protease family)